MPAKSSWTTHTIVLISFCLRSVNENLEVQEDFLDFYQLTNIKSETIVNAIKDILLGFNLQLENCRGQTYDGASNMLGMKSGVATRILAEQPKALAVHCQGHTLSLTVKQLTSSCKILGDTMVTVDEICTLVKYLSKRENLLGTIRENAEGQFDDEDNTDKFSSLDKLCLIRWTIRAACFQKVMNNYSLLMSLWEESLKEKLDTDTSSRIKGCKSKMKSFTFFFGLCLSQKLYGLTDNLLKTLQMRKMSAISGKRLAFLTIEALQGMRNDRDFHLFFELVTKKASSTSSIKQPELPRKRKRPDYSIVQ